MAYPKLIWFPVIFNPLLYRTMVLPILNVQWSALSTQQQPARVTTVKRFALNRPCQVRLRPSIEGPKSKELNENREKRNGSDVNWKSCRRVPANLSSGTHHVIISWHLAGEINSERSQSSSDMKSSGAQFKRNLFFFPRKPRYNRYKGLVGKFFARKRKGSTPPIS